MDARFSTRVVLLAAVAGAGLCLTAPPVLSPPGLGVAEAKAQHRRGYRHRGTRRHATRGRAAQTSDTDVVEVLPPERPSDASAADVTASLGPDADRERLARLRDALQTRATDVAGQSPSIAGPAAEGSTPRSIAFDFETGLKTTVFANGVTVREPFDRDVARRMTPADPRPSGAALAPDLAAPSR